MKKKLLALTLSMVLCVSMTACGNKESKEAVETTVETTAESSEEESSAVESTVAEETTTAAESTEAATETEVATETEAATETTAETETATEAEAEGAKINVTVPEGFTEAAEGMYLSPDYPNDASNIIVMNIPGSTDEIPSEEAFKEQVLSELGEEDLEAEVEVSDYEQYEVSGYDAVRLAMHYTVEGIEIYQTYVMVFADGTLGSVIYTMQGDTWADAVEDSMASITME